MSRLLMLACSGLSMMLSSSAMATVPYLDASSTGQALSMVALEIRMVDEQRKYCDTQDVPKKAIFDSYSFKWKLDNKAEVSAVQSFLEHESDDRFKGLLNASLTGLMVAFKGANLASSNAQCMNFVLELKSGARNISQRTPKASDFLKQYGREHPLSPKDEKILNDTYGCTAQGINKGNDYDFLSSYCSCLIDVMDNQMSDEEREAFNKESPVDLATQPRWGRVMSQVKECKAKSEAAEK